MEVFLYTVRDSIDCDDLLHARGGVSVGNQLFIIERESSPRTWRCFWAELCGSVVRSIFSTHVEVFLMLIQKTIIILDLLHARGGVSLKDIVFLSELKSSPRTWRCFLCSAICRRCAGIFSTHVEVFLKHEVYIRDAFDLLHARGGVSCSCVNFSSQRRSSPRTWRCFPIVGLLPEPTGIFSTHVEVFLTVLFSVNHSINLLHARGGVSIVLSLILRVSPSSPRTWRCFSISPEV